MHLKRGPKEIKSQTRTILDGWLVGCLVVLGPLKQYFSLYKAVSQREEERREKL